MLMLTEEMIAYLDIIGTGTQLTYDLCLVTTWSTTDLCLITTGMLKF